MEKLRFYFGTSQLIEIEIPADYVVLNLVPKIVVRTNPGARLVKTYELDQGNQAPLYWPIGVSDFKDAGDYKYQLFLSAADDSTVFKSDILDMIIDPSL
jgi:hypothetical protein